MSRIIKYAGIGVTALALAGMTAWELAEYYTNAFLKDIADLNIKEPHTWCKATDHIALTVQLAVCQCF